MVTAVALLLFLNDKCKPESLQRDRRPGLRFPQTAGCKARTCFVDFSRVYLSDLTYSYIEQYQSSRRYKIFLQSPFLKYSRWLIKVSPYKTNFVCIQNGINDVYECTLFSIFKYYVFWIPWKSREQEVNISLVFTCSRTCCECAWNWVILITQSRDYFEETHRLCIWCSVRIWHKRKYSEDV